MPSKPAAKLEHSPARVAPTAQDVKRSLAQHADATRGTFAVKFFKAGPGEYAEGDRFLGITVPAQRSVARSFRDLPLEEVETLLASPWHEERLTALLILVDRFQRAARRDDGAQQAAVVAFYRQHLPQVNNWDLVDSSAHQILGQFLKGQKPAARRELTAYARSKNLWQRRIAIIATHAFIREHDFELTLALAQQLLGDPHDLIHKASGWMLREVGERSRDTLRGFLRQHSVVMPRTMLRYAIEKLPPGERRGWLDGSLAAANPFKGSDRPRRTRGAAPEGAASTRRRSPG